MPPIPNQEYMLIWTQSKSSPDNSPGSLTIRLEVWKLTENVHSKPAQCCSVLEMLLQSVDDKVVHKFATTHTKVN